MEARDPQRAESTVQAPSKSPVPGIRLELSLPAIPQSVHDARTAVGELVSRLTEKDSVVADVRLCVSEAVTNVVRHAYRPSATRSGDRVDVGVDCSDDELRIVVRDAGHGIAEGEARQDPGGFGLEIIDKLTTRHTVVTGSGAGTEIAMVFALEASSARSRPHVPR